MTAKAVAILWAAFFVASLIHVPIGPSSVHLLLNGLMGLLLGWPAFPAILVGLLLQALLFQFGGLTVLGVNTFNVAAPAVASFYLLRGLLPLGGLVGMVSAFACGAVTVLLTALLTALSLAFSGEAFLTTAKLVVPVHIPKVLAGIYR